MLIGAVAWAILALTCAIAQNIAVERVVNGNPAAVWRLHPHRAARRCSVAVRGATQHGRRTCGGGADRALLFRKGERNLLPGTCARASGLWMGAQRPVSCRAG